MVLCIVVETSSCITWSDGKKKWLELSCEKVADQNIVAYLLQTIILMRAVAHAQLPCPSRCFSGLFASLSWHCVLLVLSYSVCWCWALGRFCMIFVICIGLSLSVSSLLLSAWSRVFPFMECAISAPHASICFLCLCLASSLSVCCLSVGVHLVFTDSLCSAVLFSCMIVHARLLPSQCSVARAALSMLTIFLWTANVYTCEWLGFDLRRFQCSCFSLYTMDSVFMCFSALAWGLHIQFCNCNFVL